MRPSALLLALSGMVAVAACTGGTATSPSASGTATMSAAPGAPSSAAPSTSAAAPSVSPSAAGQQIEVVGTDYAFSDVGATLTGPVSFTFKNEGQDVHELVLVRKNDDVTETFQELLAMPEEASAEKIGFMGVAMAAPGATAPETIAADQPGQYLMVCLIPQGTTSIPSMAPDASGPPEGLGDGPPHFTLGMLREFTMTD